MNVSDKVSDLFVCLSIQSVSVLNNSVKASVNIGITTVIIIQPWTGTCKQFSVSIGLGFVNIGHVSSVLCLQYICDLIVTDIFKMLRVFRKMMKMLNLKY